MPRSAGQPIGVSKAISTSPDRRSVFISYSHLDAEHLARLRVYLDQYAPGDDTMQNPFEVWDDTKIQAGNLWRDKIQAALNSAKVAVLLVSAHFFGSRFIREVELPALLNAAEADGLVILPVILSECAFKESRLRIYQSVNAPSRPLEDMKRSEQNRVWQKVASQIADVLDSSKVGNEKVEDSSPDIAGSLPSATVDDLQGEEGNLIFSMIHYLNLPRLLTIAPDASTLFQGITTPSLKAPESLRGMGLELAKMLMSAREYFRGRYLPALDITELEGAALPINQAVGVVFRFDTEFAKGKNIPIMTIHENEPFRLTGTLKKDPHISCKVGKHTIMFPLSPRWITTDTAVSYLLGDFGKPTFAGLGIIKYVSDDLVIATPLVIGTPTSPFMQAWHDAGYL